MLNTIKRIRLAIQIGNAVAAMTKAIAANGWTDPTIQQYAFALHSAVGHLRLTASEREKVVAALAGMRSDISEAARKRIPKP